MRTQRFGEARGDLLHRGVGALEPIDREREVQWLLDLPDSLMLARRQARHDAEAAAATYAPHGYYHHVPLGLLLERREAIAAGYASSFAAFPESEISNEGEVVEGNHYVHWGRFRGTLTGSWLGLPPTNRRLDLYYDLDTLCTQAGHTVEAVGATADVIRRARGGAHAAA
jgi:SnoaL-like domain